jgi:hypothetical protein
MKRWYFPRLGSGDCGHKGHCELLPDQVRVQSSVVDSDELELIVQQLQNNIPVACIQALLLDRTDTALSRGQIRALRITPDELNNLRDVTVVGGTSNTPAERLLRHLQSTERVTYIALTGERAQSGLITFRQTRKRKQHTPAVEEDVIDGMGNYVDDDSPQAFVERLTNALSLENGQKILLAVAWVTEEAKRYFKMFPEACGVDVTNGTNSEKRPNARGTLLTSNNKNIPFWNSFLPSESGWVWRWILVKAFRALLPKSGLDQMNLMITDQDPRCYEQIGAARQLGVLPKVAHRLCCWHKVNRNYSLKARSRTVTEKDKQFTRVVEKWLYSFSKNDLETREEETFSIEMFEHFLGQQSHVTDALKHFTHEFWVKVSFGNLDISAFLDIWIFGYFGYFGYSVVM